MSENGRLQTATTPQPASLFGLDAVGVWDTAKAYDHLQRMGVAQTKRSAERKLNALGLFPSLLGPESLQDEVGRPANRLVLEWAIARARQSRKRVLFLQLGHLPSGAPCLHANDGRSARYWVALADESPPSFCDALRQLQQHLNKPIAIFPHGKLTALVRDVSLPPEIDFVAAAYPPVLPADLKLPSAGRATHRARQLTEHLKRLEAESIYILREAVAEAENPVMLYSIGKDSGVMLHLARKAFYPAPPPFPLLHVDTRWKFQEMYLFRDFIARESGMPLIVYTNPEAIEKNINPFDHGSALHTEITKTQALKQAIDRYRFDVIFGGARRDEERSRAKERIFSFRTASHRWDPKNQRPELWHLYNTRKSPSESIRVFPLSNWTELDIWHYILHEEIPVVPLYFAKPRPVVQRDGMLLMVDDDRFRLLPGETIELKTVRFRTLGCYPLSGAVESTADSVEAILEELIHARHSERQGRAIDRDTVGSMEKKKQEGYF